MKKLSAVIIMLFLCLSFCLTAFAEDEQANDESVNKPAAQVEVTEDQSQPRFMVTDYKLSTDSLKPSESSELEITFKNYSNKKALFNIKLSIFDESAEIETEGMPTAYVSAVYAGSTYVWKIKITAAQTAQIGKHKLIVTSEYEDKYYMSYSATDTISVDVTQTVSLDYSGIELPPKVVEGDTQTVSVNLMNTGKTDLRNCKVDFKIDGLASGGTLFIGEIPAGENREGSSNLRVSEEKIGQVSGTATITYEDVFGKVYTKTAKLSTVICEKVELSESDKQKETNKNSLWWVFLLIGVAVGGGIGFAIPTAIHSSKQRKEDELRL